MNARVNVIAKSEEDALVVPASAVLQIRRKPAIS